MEEKDIKMARKILIRLEALDKMVFPEKPANFNFSIKKNFFGCFVSQDPNKRVKSRYTIYLPGLADALNEEKQRKVFWLAEKRGNKKLSDPTWEELLVGIAAHEVRHRFQSDCPCKKFSFKSAATLEDGLLRAAVRFTGLKFKQLKKIYADQGRTKAFISHRTNRKEFDASVIERLVANMIHRKNAYSLLQEIVAAIKLQAP